MSGGVTAAPILLLVSAGLANPQAGGCLTVWIDTHGQPAECNAVDMKAELGRYPKMCLAASADKAVVTVRLTSCREQVAAAVEPQGSAVAGREFVGRARATKGEVVKELAGHNGDSWAGAARGLCRAIVVWHRNLAESR